MFAIRLSFIDAAFEIDIKSEDIAYIIYFSIKLSNELILKQLIYYPDIDSKCGKILLCNRYK